MDSEDALKEQAEKDKQRLIEEWKQKLKQAVEDTRVVEQQSAQIQIQKLRDQYDKDFEVLNGQIGDLKSTISKLEGLLKQKDETIKDKENDIVKKDSKIRELEETIKRMMDSAAMGNQASAEF